MKIRIWTINYVDAEVPDDFVHEEGAETLDYAFGKQSEVDSIYKVTQIDDVGHVVKVLMPAYGEECQHEQRVKQGGKVTS